MLVIDDDDCAACHHEKNFPKSRPKVAHTCDRKIAERQGPVGRCVLKGKNVWAFPPGTIFMEKKLVPKVLGRPDKRGDKLLRTDRGLFPKHHVYETTDAEGNIVYWAHEGGL